MLILIGGISMQDNSSRLAEWTKPYHDLSYHQVDNTLMVINTMMAGAVIASATDLANAPLRHSLEKWFFKNQYPGKKEMVAAAKEWLEKQVARDVEA